MRNARRLLVVVLALGLWPVTAPSLRADGDQARLAALDPKYRQWLEEVALLLKKEERRQFLELTKDYQRDGFIHRFWESRNPVPGATFNAFKASWTRRLEEVRTRFGNITEDRAKMLLLRGEPSSVYKTDCDLALWPMEIWRYPGDVVLIFFQQSAGGTFRLWHKADGTAVLIAVFNPNQNNYGDNRMAFRAWAFKYCLADAATIVYAVEKAIYEDDSHLVDALFAPPPPRDAEWLATFRGVSTDLPPDAAPLPAKLELSFPARDRGRTVLQGIVAVPVAAAAAADLEGHRSYDFMLTGELLHGSELVESFRYRFDLPATAVTGDTLPLTFERTLWAGDYVLALRVEDMHSHHNFRDERPVTVPAAAALPEVTAGRRPPEVAAVLAAARADLAAPAPGTPGEPPRDPATAPQATAVDAAAGNPAASLRLVAPPGERLTGAVRLEAAASGEAIRKVTFFLDGKQMLSRIRPPYTVELNLGAVPVTRELRAVAADASGRELASDTLVLNAPQQRFAVRLVEPRQGSAWQGRVPVRAEVQVPDGSSLDRLELFLGDQRVATLYQPPFAQLIQLPALPAAPRTASGSAASPTRGGASFVRAVAYLADGAAAEDMAVINSPDVVERLDVRLVEVYAAVFDRAGHPVGRLAADDFKVFDGGVPQSLLRCERVSNLPLHLLLAIDTSASMAAGLREVQKAALAFVQRTLTPKDRAALLTFSDSPVLRLPFTGDQQALAGALAGLQAERGTALYDSLVYGLSYMKGVQHGQSALVLFTDGGDHVSRLSFDEALQFARRSGIAIYAIGARIDRLDLQIRGRLTRLAEETGGRSFFIASAAELDQVYAAIEDELRSRYLLAYQPSAPPRQGEFRPVEVRVAGDGLRVKTIRGYYP